VPRPEYGVGRPLLESATDGAIEEEATTPTTRGGPDRLVLTSTHPLRIDGPSASTRVRLQAGQFLAGALSWSRSCAATGPAVRRGGDPRPAGRHPGRLAVLGGAASAVRRAVGHAARTGESAVADRPVADALTAATDADRRCPALGRL